MYAGLPPVVPRRSERSKRRFTVLPLAIARNLKFQGVPDPGTRTTFLYRPQATSRERVSCCE